MEIHDRPLDSQPAVPVSRASALRPAYGLGSLLLVFVLVGGCLALCRVDPILSLVAAGCSAAALVRTSRNVDRLIASGQNPGNGLKLAIFINSATQILAACSAMLLVAGIFAGLGWVAGAGLEHVLGEGWIAVLFTTWALVLGLPAGLFVAERILAAR
jgi:hypothetical protein